MVRGRRLRRVLGGAGLFTCVCVLWLVPTATAAGSAQQSGVYDQYTEQIPTAGGPKGTGSGGTGSGTGSSGAIALPANLKTDGGNDAKKLREVATSTRYGSPSATVPLPQTSGSSPAALSSAVNAITDGSDGHMVGLFVALLAVTAVSFGVAAARRRGA